MTDCTYGIEECNISSVVPGAAPGVICQAKYIVNSKTKKLQLYSKGCSHYNRCQEHIYEGSGNFLNSTKLLLSRYVMQ